MSSLSNKTILIVDLNLRKSLQVSLQNEGAKVILSADPMQAYIQLTEHIFDLVVFDVYMGEISGIDLLKKMQKNDIQVPVIFMSGNANLNDAFKAVHLGAFDFLQKPFNPEKLILSINRCLEYNALKSELSVYKKSEDIPFIGDSSRFKEMLKKIHKVSPTNSPVLIVGESGTGKELIAREIHRNSKASKGPFIKINCSAIPETLFESEFFGYERGAFTGAQSMRKGYFEQAHNGTMLLDEIGTLPLPAQAKLLRVLQMFEIQRLGSEKSFSVNVRVIASTNADLKKLVDDGLFREDLFFRLNVFPINSIALRDRKSDIPNLSELFLSKYLESNQMPKKFISPAVYDLLKKYSWPGNIRELKNFIERLAIVAGQTISDEDLPDYLKHDKSLSDLKTGISLKEFRRITERGFIVKTLVDCKGNISEAAENLQIERTYLHKKIQQYDIAKKEFFV